MITREDDVDIHALRRQGWTITAIANHVGRDQKRSGLPERQAGAGGARRARDPFGPFVEYVTARLVEDPHLWAVTLFDELTELGFTASYPSLTREVRTRHLRPVCRLRRATGRAKADHPAPGLAGDPVGLAGPSRPTTSGGWASMAHLRVGSLAHSGRWRGYLSAVMDQPHLVEGLDRITRGLGGLTRQWRFDRMATVCHPRLGADHRHLLRRREALRGDDQDLPAPGRASQRGGGEGQPRRRATRVAHPRR